MFLSPGNCNLVYAIIRKRNVFHQLANLPSDPSSIQKALQRKKKSPDVISRTSSQETVSMEGSHPAVPAEPGTLKASLVAMPGNDSTCCLYGNVVITKQSIHCVVGTAHITYIFTGHFITLNPFFLQKSFNFSWHRFKNGEENIPLRFWSILIWHHTVTAHLWAVNSWWESPVPPHCKGAL